MRKPDGMTFIGPSKIERFMESLPVEKFFGVGKVTAGKMKHMGLHTGADLKKLTEAEMIRNFGKAGKFYYKIVRGIDDREVRPDRETKSVGAEDTFPYDLKTFEEMCDELDKISRIVCDRLQRHNLKGRTLTVKIKYHNFKLVTRSQSFGEGIDDYESVSASAKKLLEATNPEDVRIRLLGISLSNFHEAKTRRDEISDQLTLEL